MRIHVHDITHIIVKGPKYVTSFGRRYIRFMKKIKTVIIQLCYIIFLYNHIKNMNKDTYVCIPYYFTYVTHLYVFGWTCVEVSPNIVN